MTKREYLSIMRQPEYCGINARANLKAMVSTSGKAIHCKIALRVVDKAIGNFVNCIK